MYHFTCCESNHTKILKCFITLCPRLSETFLLLFTDSVIIQVTENTNIFAQEESSIKKSPSANVESFLMSPFDLNQTGKIVFTKNCSI